jgi:hypothetical protein
MRTAPQSCVTHSRPSLRRVGACNWVGEFVARWRQCTVCPVHAVTARSLPPFGMIDRVGAVAQLLGDMRSHTRTETVCIQSVPDSRRSKGCLLRCARTSPSLNADDVQPVRTPPVASLRANHAEGYPATPALGETRVALMDEGCEQCMSSLPLLMHLSHTSHNHYLVLQDDR